MSKDLNTNQNRNLTNSQKAQEVLLASDDVHRVALRRPALYQTKLVPQIQRRRLSLDGFEGHGGVA